MLFPTATFVSSLLLATCAFAKGDKGSAAASGAMMASPMPAASTGVAANSAAASSGQVPVYVVKVSDKNGSKVFTPNDMQVPVGAMVQFQFYPMNHSVVSASFAKPCEPISNGNASASQLFSGYMPVKAGGMMPTYTIMINDTKPIWLYCSQMKHCQAGMVAAINAKSSTGKTLAAFKAAAANAPNNLAPGQLSASSSSSSSSSNSSSSGAGVSAGTSAASSAAATSAAAAAASSGVATNANAASGSMFAGAKNIYGGAALAGALAAVCAFAL